MKLAAVLLVAFAFSGCASSSVSHSTSTRTQTPQELAKEYARAARCHRDPTHCQELTERQDLEAEAEKP